MPPVSRTQMFCLLQNSSWWLCMAPTFLAFYFGDLFHTGYDDNGDVKDPCACSWKLQLDLAGDFAQVHLYWLALSQLIRLLLWIVFLFFHFRSTLIQKVPLRCLSWSRRDWSIQMPIPICYPSSSTACRCHVSIFTFPEQEVLENWVKLWCSQIPGHTLPLLPVQNLAVANELGILHCKIFVAILRAAVWPLCTCK